MTLRFQGKISVYQLRLVLMRALAGCPEAVGFDTVNDGRAKHSELALDQVVRLAEMKRELGLHDHRRRCVGLVGDKSQTSFLTMLQVLCEDSKVARLTTDSIETAAAWLCRPKRVILGELKAVEEMTHKRAPRPRRKK